MERKSYNLILALTFTVIFTIASANPDQAETYIVHLNAPDGVTFNKHARQSWYNSFLTSTNADSDVKPSLIHSYHHVFTGFAAKLSPSQVKAMENKNGFVSARRERVYNLHTTHTPNFLGLHQNLGLWSGSNYGKGIIIGVLDTGITPGHPSFDDKDVPPPPAKWKGKCEVAGCNNKLIGARDFTNGGSGSGSPLDDEGHGTHTSSTAGGNFVDGANVFGNANGTAAGMAPLAHVAMYKVCDSFGCLDSAILAGMDAAIEEGVDVLSLSLGGGSVPFYEDGIAVGAFSAIQKGIFVSCSAGNDGPVNSTLSNEAPWILTVGASTIDRNIRATVSLGNQDLLDGESLYQPKDFPQTLLPLVYPGLTGGQNVAWCAPGSLDGIDVKGKVVLCDRGGDIARIDKGQTVKGAGGAAMILANEEIDGDTTEADAHVLPASHVAYKLGVAIKTYINSTSSPLATIIFKGTIIGVKSAPAVASFSSRGPSLSSPGIVKPDIIGPGVSILAAWPVSLDNSTTKATFNMISGTSMSCPHLSGISALLKSAHPDWSPAAIKSAIMTTADRLNLNGQLIQDERDLTANIFAIGAGHVNPSKANDPGLIFDIQPDDYIPYLCGLGYTSKQVGVIVQKRVTCTTVIPEAQLNYPSFAVTLGPGDAKTYSRTVTNVGAADSTYTMTDVSLPIGLDLFVFNTTLAFSELNQKLAYGVRFIRDQAAKPKAPYAEGYMTWTSDKYTVRTPYSVNFV